MTSLTVSTWDPRKSTNEKAHKTDLFINGNLVTRRAASVTIEITLSRAMQRGERLNLMIETGPSPSESTNTRIIMPVSTTGSKTSWSATSSSTGSKMVVSINIPPNALLGIYTLSAQTISGGRTTVKRFGIFYVLCNAWSTEDEVSMSSEAERTEYVLNDSGLIAYGNTSYRGNRAWDIAQHGDGILDIVFEIINKNALRDPNADISKRNSVVYLARVLSAMINSNDDSGVVRGDWSGNYTSDNNPSRWNGSSEILHRWFESGPVAYGQCWVFAGVLCTTLRALGIPCRIITNYESAHDTNGNMTIDRLFDSNGRLLPETADSVWNFHVWNEIWCKRKALGINFDGWQVVDATPQERSGGIYRLGPASLAAIYGGFVHLDYDCAFAFAEVNADKVNWLSDSNGELRKISTDTRSVGQFISTKAINEFRMVDVTRNYKDPEGSAKERETFRKAQENLSGPRFMVMGRSAFAASEAPAAAERSVAPAPKPDFTGSFSVSRETQRGEDLIVSFNLKNTSNAPKDIKAKTTSTAIIYTGTQFKEIKKEDIRVKLGPNEEKTTPITIKYEDYKNNITDDNMIRFVAVCEDEKGGHLICDLVVTLVNPPLQITVSGAANKSKSLTIEISFANPINENVAKSTLTIEGFGLLQKPLKIPISDLKPKQRSVTHCEIHPYRAGKRCLMVNFFSDAFPVVKAYKEITVVN